MKDWWTEQLNGNGLELSSNQVMCSTQALLAVISLDQTPQVSMSFQSWNLRTSLSGRQSAPFECPRFRTRHKRFHKTSVFSDFSAKNDIIFWVRATILRALKKTKIAMDPISLDVKILTDYRNFHSSGGRLQLTKHPSKVDAPQWDIEFINLEGISPQSKHVLCFENIT